MAKKASLARVQPAERELEVRVVYSGGVGGMDAAVKLTRTYSRRPLAYATATLEQKLNELNKLAAGGYITPEEYKAKKQALLSSL